MAIAPFAEKRLIPRFNKIPMKNYRRVNIHVAVSNSNSLYGVFSAPTAGACSHFYVTREGVIEQYIDTRYQSAADLHGSDSTISIENEGGVTDPNGEKFTLAQMVGNAMIWAWARDTHQIRNQMAKNTQTTANSLGLSWHRLGVQGNFKGRGGILEVSYKPGGILYSRARGKECPGDAKILQIDDIFAMAKGKTYKEIGKGKPSDAKPTGSKPKPVQKPVADQSPTNTPNGSLNFPDNYADLPVNGNWKSWEIGALQILLHNILGDESENQRWDGKFEKLTIKDFQQLLKRNGYYDRTPFAAKGVPKGTILEIDGDDGYWFWVAVQRMLADEEGNRANGKVYYNTKKWLIDGKPGEATYKGLAAWLNDNN